MISSDRADRGRLALLAARWWRHFIALFVLTFVISWSYGTSSIPDPVAFGRQYMVPLLELLLGWVLLV